jgi:DNA-binding transcriptional ArsR family regulator
MLQLRKIISKEVYYMTKNKCGLPHHHGNDEERIISRLPSQETIDDVSILLKQLSDPTRLKIFWILCHIEECVINIAAIMDMSSPAISHHLRLLKACGLITSRRNGKEMYYKAADTEIVSELHYAIDKIAAITCPD